MRAPRVYLDHAASAPLAPEAWQAMERVLKTLHGNPSSPHAEGRAAKDALEDARSRVAAALGCRPREVVFTSSGTEAANLGVCGAARARAAAGRRIVLSAVEHPCVSEAALGLRAEGFEVVRVPVDRLGQVDPGRFAAEATTGTALACLILVNHETGNLLPVAAVAERLRTLRVPLLVDAALAPGRLEATAGALPGDLLVLSGHKFGGPKGSGALVVRRPTRIEPLFRGGLQEDRARPGTEDVAAAAGFAAALEAALRARPERVRALDGAVAGFLQALAPLPGWSRLGDSVSAVPGLLTLELDGVEGEAVMINLDLKGVAVATGSTCALGGTDPSPSLLAMGLTPQRAAATIRISPGPSTTPEEAQHAGRALVEAVQRLRALARR
jgi:cysteine desulfurase